MTTTSQADLNTNGGSSAAGVGASLGVGLGGSAVGCLDDGASSAHKVTSNKATTTAATMSTNNLNATTNGNNSSGNAQRATSNDSNTKRKKWKSRNAANLPSSQSQPTVNGSSGGGIRAAGGGGSGGGGARGSYAKDHLDAWLENCLRDATNTQLSSSSEFLDFNPTNNRAAFTAQQMQQQQQQQQHIEQQQQQQQQMTMPQQQQQQQQQMQNLYNFNAQQQAQQQQQQQQQQQSPLQQQLPAHQQFLLRSASQPYAGSGNTGSGSYATPFGLGIQRHTPNYMRSTNSLSSRIPMMFSTNMNGDGSVSGLGGYYAQHDGSQDFASLPPIVNMLSGMQNSEHENNSTDVLDGSGSNQNINRGFRFSDPCLLNPSDNESKPSGQNTPDRRTANMPGNEADNNKFFAALMEQINILHETNSKICRNLHETKVDIEALKHAPASNWVGMRHRRDSLSGLSTQSQPLVFGGGFGTQSPAPTFHSGAYTPGMMTDVVREVKEAARVREDALLNRVKSMVEERQWSVNEGNVRILRDIDELKTYVLHMRLERKEINKRLNHLEAENRYMRQLLASLYNNRNAPDVIYEDEALRTRSSKPRRSQTFTLQYGTIHQQPSAPTCTTQQQQQHHQQQQQAGDDDAKTAQQRNQQQQQAEEVTDLPLRSSFSSTDSCMGSSGQVALNINKTTTTTTSNGGGGGSAASTHSPPNFALVSPVETPKLPFRAGSKEQTQDADRAQLKRELSEAVAARNEADQRIIVLENLVSSLSVAATGQLIEPTFTTARTTTTRTTTNHITNGLGHGGSVDSVGGGVRNVYSELVSTTNNKWPGKQQEQQQQQQQHQQKTHQHQQQLHQHSNNNNNHNASAISTTSNSNTSTNMPYNINSLQMHATTISMAQTSATGTLGGATAKLSVAGPITDL